jgi:hypothetical protein
VSPGDEEEGGDRAGVEWAARGGGNGVITVPSSRLMLVASRVKLGLGGFIRRWL